MKVGIDFGGSHIAIALVDSQGNIVQKLEQDIIGKEKIEQVLVDYVESSLEIFKKIADISYIGIAAPGNPKGAIIKNLVNLGLKEINFQRIEEKYQINIKSINDAKAAALAEKTYGAMKGVQDGVFLCLGTGIGGAVFLNGSLLQANRNPGFELGHMVIEKEGNPCNCGKKGCFETYCSIKRFKDSIVQELRKKGKNICKTNAIEILETIKEQIEDDDIKRLVNTYIDNLVIGLSNVIDIFEPEVIVLGGSFVHFKEILYQKLLDTMEKRKYVFNKETLPQIKLATFQNDAGLIGATLL